MTKLTEWLKETARINDTVSDTWREEDAERFDDWTYWMPNGVQDCIECTDEEAEYIRENFEDLIRKTSF